MTSSQRPQSLILSFFKGFFTNNVSTPLKIWPLTFAFSLSSFEGLFANAVSTHSRSLTLTIGPARGDKDKDLEADPSGNSSIEKGLLANEESGMTLKLAEPEGGEATRRGIVKCALVYNKESPAITITPCRPFQLLCHCIPLIRIFFSLHLYVADELFVLLSLYYGHMFLLLLYCHLYLLIFHY